ncbi:MAG: acylphosphatase [Thermosipho sp. (in: Bacteria)]|nr:acylphosphatase [Thermosipho sp. (in: thermotogales)]
MKWIKLNVFGIVQGVGFRYYIKTKAKAFGIKGYVKNELDGSVTIVAGGNEVQLEALKEYIKIGNGYSHVKEIIETEISPQKFDDFYIQY